MSTQNIPGMIFPKQIGMLAGNPRDSAIAEMKHSNAIQAQANKAMAGGKYSRNKKYTGGTNVVAVPQFNMSYKPTGAPGTNPNDQIAGNLKTSTQSLSWSSMDKLSGGKKKSKGGNPNWVWGCSSGGKKRKHKTTKRKHKITKRKHKTTKRKY